MLTSAPRPDQPYRVALLCSRRAPGLEQLLADRGPAWQLVVGVSSDPACAELPSLERAGIPTLVRDLGGFCRAHRVRRDDLGARAEYDRETARWLAPFEPDLVVLCGYLHVVTPALLDAVPRMVNVHDGDLTRTDADGRVTYRGLRSTLAAVRAGEPETRSTVHLVTAEVDQGPPLVRSWAFPVSPMIVEMLPEGDAAEPLLRAYAYAQREWMMRASWGPLLRRTVELFAHGEVRVLDGRVTVAGRPGPLELERPGRSPALRLAQG